MPLPAQRLDSLSAVQFTPGTFVRVAAGGPGYVEGTVRNGPPGAMILRRAGAETSLTFDRIDSLWVRHTDAGLGAAVGLVSGLLVGTVAAGAVFEGPAPGPGATRGLTVIGGGLIGGFLGAAIGSGSIKWELRFP